MDFTEFKSKKILSFEKMEPVYYVLKICNEYVLIPSRTFLFTPNIMPISMPNKISKWKPF